MNLVFVHLIEEVSCLSYVTNVYGYLRGSASASNPPHRSLENTASYNLEHLPRYFSTKTAVIRGRLRRVGARSRRETLSCTFFIILSVIGYKSPILWQCLIFEEASSLLNTSSVRPSSSLNTRVTKFSSFSPFVFIDNLLLHKEDLIFCFRLAAILKFSPNFRTRNSILHVTTTLSTNSQRLIFGQSGLSVFRHDFFSVMTYLILSTPPPTRRSHQLPPPNAVAGFGA